MHTEHHITRRHRPISRCDAPSRSCLLPLLPQLPPRRRLRRAHYFRVTADRARRTPPSHTPAAHAVDCAHPRTRFAPRTATSLPATLAARRQRQPRTNR